MKFLNGSPVVLPFESGPGSWVELSLNDSMNRPWIDAKGVGTILGPCLCHFGNILAPFWNHFGTIFTGWEAKGVLGVS